MENMKINQLPSRTWNWLKMNETAVSGISVSGAHKGNLEIPDGITKTVCPAGLPDRFKDIAGGMGSDMDMLVKESAAGAVLLSADSDVSGEPARIRFSYGASEHSQNTVGILAKEIPADYEAEALKGQAVLVRTEVCRKIQETGNDGTLEEEYWTAKQMKAAWGMQYTQNYRKLKDALEETTGQVLFYGEGLAITPFFKLSNGYTRDAKEVLGKEDYPYLKSVECPADAEAENELQTGVLGENEKKIETTDIEILETDSVGYVLKVRVGEETISGEEFRNRYSLPSSCFTLQRYHDKLWVTTRGIGHGIGMSQYTANEMAKEKKSYKKILKYFFEGTEIREVTEIIKNVEEQK